jgi:hypothetical protein
MATAGAGACGDLSALAKGGLIDPSLANGLKNDFKFEVASSALERGCEIFATPVSKSGGTRSFMVSQDGVLRAAKKNGARADKQDTPVGN